MIESDASMCCIEWEKDRIVHTTVGYFVKEDETSVVLSDTVAENGFGFTHMIHKGFIRSRVPVHAKELVEDRV